MESIANFGDTRQVPDKCCFSVKNLSEGWRMGTIGEIVGSAVPSIATAMLNQIVLIIPISEVINDFDE